MDKGLSSTKEGDRFCLGAVEDDREVGLSQLGWEGPSGRQLEHPEHRRGGASVQREFKE